MPSFTGIYYTPGPDFGRLPRSTNNRTAGLSSIGSAGPGPAPSIRRWCALSWGMWVDRTLTHTSHCGGDPRPDRAKHRTADTGL